MIFSGDLCDKVLDGTKTVTRRPVTPGQPCRYAVGKTYAVQRKRGTNGLGPRINVTAVSEEPVFPLTTNEAIREGFSDPVQFETRWIELYGVNAPTRVWRIEFELVPSPTSTTGDCIAVAPSSGETNG